MTIARDARERWRRGLIGRVPLASPRGIAGTFLLVLGGFLLFVPPLLGLAAWLVEGDPGASGGLTKEVLAASMAANALLLLVVPIVVIVLTRPGERGAPARRLRMTIDRKTPLFALVGIGVTLGSLLALGIILTLLDETGIYHAEESDLVPQIQALLTPAIILAVPLLAAVTEEVYFRGFLQPRVGIIASSALFGLVHSGYGTVLQLIAPFFLGLMFGYLFQKTRSLWAPIAAHFAFDFVQFVALYLLR